MSLLCENDSSLYLSDKELEERYDSYLDDCFEVVKIGLLKYDPSDVLKNVDPIAYRCGLSDWLDSECENEVLGICDGRYYLEKDTYDSL